MKSYVKPELEYIEMRPEERLAVASCIEYGSCGDDGCTSYFYGQGPT